MKALEKKVPNKLDLLKSKLNLIIFNVCMKIATRSLPVLVLEPLHIHITNVW